MTAAEAAARENTWLDAQLVGSPELTPEQLRVLRRMFDPATEAAS